MKGILLSNLLQCAGMSRHDYLQRREEVKQYERLGRYVLTKGQAGEKEYKFIAKDDVDDFLKALGLEIKEVYQGFYKSSIKDFRV